MNQNSKMKSLALIALGFCLACLVAQAAPVTTYFTFDRYPVGRYQLVARGNTKDVWIIDTATGHFCFYTPSTSNAVPSPMVLVHKDRFYFDNYMAEQTARKDWKDQPAESTPDQGD